MSQDDDDVKRRKEETRQPFWREEARELRLIELIERLGERVETNDEESRRRDEENQRNINFILGQQAQFTADMQQMREVQARAEEKWENTANGINALLAIAEIHDREIKTLAEVQAEAQARTDKQMAETDERLNALVNVVERLISERRNGGANAD